jgi:hypothetical protein
MMLDRKNKGLATIIVAGMKDKSTPSDKPKADDSEAPSDGLLSAAQELLNAIEAKDAASVVSTLENFLMIHKSEEESEPDSMMG